MVLLTLSALFSYRACSTFAVRQFRPTVIPAYSPNGGPGIALPVIILTLDKATA